MMKTALELPGPSAIRYPRGVVVGVTRKAEPQAIPVGKAEVITGRLGRGHSGSGTDDDDGAANWPSGWSTMGYSAAVINPRFVKPIDREMLERVRAARGCLCHL